MHKKVLVTMLSALALTACGGEDNQSASTTNKSVIPLQLRHVAANYNPAEVCRDLKKTWDKKLSSKSEQVTCAYFPAPLNMPASANKGRTADNADTFDIFYMHYRASAERWGTLFYNPGGPADATPMMGNALLELDLTDPDILKHYDVVTFDPRGTGYSALAHELRTCLLRDKSAVKPAMKPAEVAALFAKELANEPDDKAGEANAPLDAYGKSTADYLLKQCDGVFQQYSQIFGANTIAADMDALRQYLNLDKITPYMASYGTRVAAIYAYRYPERVANIILDSPMSPINTDYFSMIKEDGHNWQNIIDWRFDGQALLQSETVANQIKDSDKYTDKMGNEIDIGQWTNIVNDSVESAHEDQITFWIDDDATETLARIVREKAEEEQGENSIMSAPLYTAIHCADNTQPYRWQDLDSEDAAFHGAGSSVLFGGFSTCADWPYPRSPIPAVQANEIQLAPDAIALILGSEFDSRTPYSGAEQMQAAFGPAARLVKVEQSSQHGQLGIAACVDQSLKSLLLGDKTKIQPQQSCEPYSADDTSTD
ncbi:alpha/beta fold hydrolase [Aeromonas sp. MdU4]|uniref:alpha/beta fold hydrolase n=1 Tax=Aeromonas sp. MdU4 TaxID=3342819 RepID=UPI0035B9B189